MDDFKEFVGSSLDEAKEKARDYFNSNHIEYEMMPPKFLTVITGKRDVRIKARKMTFTDENIEYQKSSKLLLEQMIKAGDFDVIVEETHIDNSIRYNLSGPDSKLFSGNKGRLLDSFQHIVVKSCNGKSTGINIIVDADDYKLEREEFIKSYVNKAINTVRRSKKPYILKPMNPSERRMVHLIVQEETDLNSESLGDGHYKKVKIARETNEKNG